MYGLEEFSMRKALWCKINSKESVVKAAAFLMDTCYIILMVLKIKDSVSWGCHDTESVSLINQGGASILYTLVILHLVVLKLRNGDIAPVIHHCLTLGNHVSQDHVCSCITLCLLLQISTSLSESIDLVYLTLISFLLEPWLLFVVENLLTCATSLAAHLA